MIDYCSSIVRKTYLKLCPMTYLPHWTSYNSIDIVITVMVVVGRLRAFRMTRSPKVILQPSESTL